MRTGVAKAEGILLNGETFSLPGAQDNLHAHDNFPQSPVMWEGDFDAHDDFLQDSHRRHQNRSGFQTKMNGSRRPEQVFIERASTLLKTDADEVKELFSARPKKAIRTNGLRRPAEMTTEMQTVALEQALDLEDVGHERLAWFAGSLLFQAEDMVKVQSTPEIQEGYGFVQSPSSYLAVVALEPGPGQSIIDVCAAPGGKASLIADMVGNESVIVTNELKARRVQRMQDVFEQLGVDGVRIMTNNAKHLGKIIGEATFDRVLADVECSTEAGINFESKDALRGWSMERVERSAQLQRQIIRSSYDLLRPGGLLVYSTCSLAS